MTVNVSDWSETPDSNSTVDGINIAEGCPAGNMNGGLRAVMAAVKTLYLALPNVSGLMAKAGGVFTGAISQTGAGAYRHNADSALSDGRTYYLAEGAARPASPGPGMLVFYYPA